MSVSSLLQPQTVTGRDWSQLYVKSVNTSSANLNNGAITNVASINGSLAGTATSLGFYNGALVAQPTASGASGYSSVGGTAVLSNDRFTGGIGSTAYTIGDIVKALKQVNLIVN